MPGPVAVYPLNAKHRTYPISPYNVPPGKLVGVALAEGPNGEPGGSYAFAGTASSYIEFPSGSRLDIKSSITLVALVYPEAPGPIIDYSAGALWATHWWMSSMTRLHWSVRRRNLRKHHITVQNDILEIGQWNFVAATYDHSTGMSASWLEGYKIGELNAGIYNLATDYPIRMGVRDGDSRHFKGRISCLQFYNRVLSQEEIIEAKTKCLSTGMHRFSFTEADIFACSGCNEGGLGICGL